MLRNMPGGSIGIAGSRGAGKTTLLRHFCGPNRIITNLNGKQVLGILVSAPVAYQARDFLLYLFSTACRSVIEAEEDKKLPPPFIPDRLPEPERLPDVRTLPGLRELPRVLTSFGLGFLVLGLISALALTALTPAEAPMGQTPTTNVTAAPGGVPAGTPIGNAQSPAPDHAATADRQRASQPASFGRRWVAAVKIDPGSIVTWGATFVVLGLMVASLIGQNVWEVFISSLRMFSPLRYLPSVRRRLERERRYEEEEEEPRQRFEYAGLRDQASAWLRTTKFQQSFTSGWSGSLKLPVGLEGSVNRAVTLAQNQLSLPEISSFLFDFLQIVSGRYQVLIGIDELDKLASDDLARQFINDIKSIFGLERCFYLVSVSENAMSSFERRGMPFRDEFDSAFDDFIYVDHLNFQFAAKLLEQRVVGRPIPFFALSYCMSGGLPRDLIRSFRNILEAYEQDKKQGGLSAICLKIVSGEVIAKVRAVSSSAQKIQLQPQVDQFTGLLYGLELAATSDESLIKLANAMLSATFRDELIDPAPLTKEEGRSVRSRDKKGDEKESLIQQLQDLAEEIATFVLYVATLRRFFTDSLEKEQLDRAIENGDIDRLARARRLLGANPTMTRSALHEFSSVYITSPVADRRRGRRSTGSAGAPPTSPLRRPRKPET